MNKSDADTRLKVNKVMYGDVHAYSSNDASTQSLNLLARLTVTAVDEKKPDGGTVKFRIDISPDPDFVGSRCQFDIPQLEIPMKIYNQHPDHFEFRIVSEQMKRSFTFRIRKYEKPAPRAWQAVDAAKALNDEVISKGADSAKKD
jgi:hypothetical protein